jgi:hypothetical protein
MTELKEITSFHEDLKNDLGVLFSSLPISVRDAYRSIINAELDRVKKLEDRSERATRLLERAISKAI